MKKENESGIRPKKPDRGLRTKPRRAIPPSDVFAVVLASAATFQYHAAGPASVANRRRRPRVPVPTPNEGAGPVQETIRPQHD